MSIVTGKRWQFKDGFIFLMFFAASHMNPIFWFWICTSQQKHEMQTHEWKQKLSNANTGINTVTRVNRLSSEVFWENTLELKDYTQQMSGFSIGQRPHNPICFKGFDIQMRGPGLLSKIQHGVRHRSTSNMFHTIQQKPGSARSADVFHLNPNLTYWFWVIPKARQTEGEPSKILRIGPGTSDCLAEYVLKVKAVGPVANRWRPEWTRHCWHRGWNPLQPPPPAAPVGWCCLPLGLL